jgi:hypothetical protein
VVIFKKKYHSANESTQTNQPTQAMPDGPFPKGKRLGRKHTADHLSPSPECLELYLYSPIRSNEIMFKWQEGKLCLHLKKQTELFPRTIMSSQKNTNSTANENSAGNASFLVQTFVLLTSNASSRIPFLTYDVASLTPSPTYKSQN